MVYDPDFGNDVDFIPASLDPDFGPQPLTFKGYFFVGVTDQNRPFIEDALYDAGCRERPVPRDIHGTGDFFFKCGEGFREAVKKGLADAKAAASHPISEEERRAINASRYSDNCFLNKRFR